MPNQAIIDKFNAKLELRKLGVPLQHLLGYAYFLDVKYYCDNRALIPRFETEELSQYITSSNPQIAGNNT